MAWTGPLGKGTTPYTADGRFPGAYPKDIVVIGSNKHEVVKVKEIPFTNDEEYMKNAGLWLERWRAKATGDGDGEGPMEPGRPEACAFPAGGEDNDPQSDARRDVWGPWELRRAQRGLAGTAAGAGACAAERAARQPWGIPPFENQGAAPMRARGDQVTAPCGGS